MGEFGRGFGRPALPIDDAVNELDAATGPARPYYAPSPLSMIDPGWLFLLAGIVIIGATVLIPAYNDLADVRWQRDRALAVEQRRIDRLERHSGYLRALQREEPSLVLALAASQLNQIPEGRSLVLEPADPATASASVFAGLEPPAVPLPEQSRVGSLLETLATNDLTRTWLLAAGGVSLLVGLLPRVGRRF